MHDITSDDSDLVMTLLRAKHNDRYGELKNKLDDWFNYTKIAGDFEFSTHELNFFFFFFFSILLFEVAN